MKVAIIGSTRYARKMREYFLELFDMGCWVETPTFDNDALNELQVVGRNKTLIEWADEVHVMWDGQSGGLLFDMGMCFALNKRVKMVYENNRTFSNLFKQMEESNDERCPNQPDTNRTETKEECR